MNDFLAFRKMLTPVLVQILFWISLVGVVIWAFQVSDNALLSLFMIIAGAISVRVYCEILIVVFRILDVLTDIRRNTGGGES